MRSTLVRAHKVLSPFGSYYFESLIASDVEISTLAITTHKIIVRGSSMYFLQRFVVTSSMLSGWSEFLMGILVIPGKSTNDKSGTFFE